jgi:hypothetical protein
MRLRFILPSINLVASAVALIHDNLRGFAGKDPGPSAVLLACDLVNAPALVIRRIAEFAFGRLVPEVCNPVSLDSCYRAERITSVVVFMAGLAMLWYLVGRAVEAEWLGKGSVANPRDWRRGSLDAAVILFAMFCGVIGVLNWRERSYPLNLPLPFLSYSLWGLLLTVLYGRDLVRCCSHDRSDIPSH